MNKRNKIILGLVVLFAAVLLFVYDSLEKSGASIPSNSQVANVQEKIEKIKEIKEKINPREVVLLGRAELSYEGSTTGRGKNIELGVERIDGTVVLPGEEFSYTKALGPVDEGQGFSKEKAFKNGEVTLGLGGGLCQVSTILFQTALSAGLPITERYNHTFSVPFYQTGLDATYADPGPDLRFLNDTGYEMTIRGRTENKKAIFEIYGVSDGRKSSVSEAEVTNKTPLPETKYKNTFDLQIGEKKCEHSPQIGYNAKRIYDVIYGNSETKQQIFASTYKPLPRICYLGVGTPETVGCTDSTIYSPLTGKKCPDVL